MAKEIQLSLAFCGALAAMILISAPVNEMTALTGSGIAFLISGGFFYGGINKYFADKEQREQHTQDIIATSLKDLTDNQNRTGEQFKTIIDNQNRTGEQFRAIIDNQNRTGEQFKAVVAAIENLDDALNDKLIEMTDTLSAMSENVSGIKADAGNIENNTSKLAALQKSAKSILDEISELSEGVGEVSKVNDALRELMNALDNQKEFYQTILNQYKGMTAKDVELIENLARKLR